MQTDELLRLIELKRKQMIESSLQFGLTHPKTVICSEDLDKLLNILMKFKG